MLLLLTYLIIALFISFLCSIMESVLLSTPQSFLIVNADKGKKWASVFLKLKQNIDKPLSAILSLNTVAHTVGAAGVGAQAIVVFGEAYFGLVSAVLTLLILIFTEIIPKTIGAQYWRGLSSFTAHSMRVMVVITYPLVLLSAIITKVISKNHETHTTSREELSVLASIGAKEGIFEEKEHKIIQNLLRLRNVRVSEVMTPRTVVSVADQEMTLDEFLENKQFIHSRIPVFSGNEENITGYIFRQTVLQHLAEEDETLRLKNLRREIVVVPDSKPLFGVWETLLEKREHIALVVDEYGGMDGIVTMEDIIETIFGLEIIDEKDTITDMRQYARERWTAKQEEKILIEKHRKKV